MPRSSASSPYLHFEGEEDDRETDHDTPEVVINAATQIRGHGNIISIAQMDSVRIANLITSLLNCGDKIPVDDATRPLTPPSPVPLATAQAQRTTRTQVRGVHRYPNINITVNCGATVLGDRNIVGPGLGDIARQMQMAQRNQAAALQAHQQLQQRQAAAAAAVAAEEQKTASPPLQRSGSMYQTATSPSQYCRQVPLSHGVATPPMSRSSSLHSDGESRKRKGADVCEAAEAKRRC
ncbi:hypothetical protein COCMIDRAFT_6096 [Bipolaris oryzae ATCC 44560]|uniref:Uncharacterized protein n=1 Tax=Bipolaris oryzae ATCC 44560 TaxID=930090 RepID=W6Z3P8_COCMI|nr:uncharacterized protein COCMIDRAFT_6096 [Bipolaris oryzae ATCC 44560]EUC44585.1 hypothetical protein COCMIDRAFT_6096 [Bipolaris oryzae ATCC 44560]